MRQTIAARLYPHPAALALFFHLEELAADTGRTFFQTNRDKLCKPLGIKKPDTITGALKVLKAERLLNYKVRTVVTKTGETRGRYLQIFLRKTRCNGFSGNRFSERKTRLNGASGNGPSEGKTRLKGTSLPYGRTAGASAMASAPPHEAEPPQASQEDIDRALGK